MLVMYQEGQAAKFYLGPLYCSGQPQVSTPIVTPGGAEPEPDIVSLA